MGLVTTYHDPQGRSTVFEKLPKALPRVISVGRLDLNSEGLLLLTNDGEWARKMELPSSRLDRTYRVKVHGNLTGEVMARLSKGVKVDGIQYAPAKIVVEKKQGTNTWIQMTLTEGKNREIRRMLESQNIGTKSLVRVRIGNVLLGQLRPGEYRDLTSAEVKGLLKESCKTEDKK